MATRKGAQKRKRLTATAKDRSVKEFIQAIGDVIVPMALRQAMLSPEFERRITGQIARAIEARIGEATQREIIIPRYKSLIDRRIIETLKSLRFGLSLADVPFNTPEDEDEEQVRGGLYVPHEARR